MTAELVLRDVRLADGSRADLRVADGRIAAIGRDLAAREGVPVEEGRGALLVEPFVETHVHLDKILWGLPWQPVDVEPELRAMIRNEKRIRNELPWSVEERASNLLAQCVACGSAFIRSHVDIDPDYGLANVEGVLAAHRRHAHAVDLELVAFPQTGMLTVPGTLQVMADALDAGCSIVGGIDPAGIDGDPKGHLDAIFGLAERKGAKMDIHLHEAGELGLFSFGLILERTRALGMQGRVVVSHAFCLADAAGSRQERLLREIVELDVGIVSAVPGNRAIPPLFALEALGGRVAIASDSLRDTWNPHGNGDLLERAWLLAWRLGLKRDSDLERALALATTAAARLVGRDELGLRPGAEASFFLVEGDCRAEAVVSRRPRRLVLKRGRVVARDGHPIDEGSEGR